MNEYLSCRIGFNYSDVSNFKKVSVLSIFFDSIETDDVKEWFLKGHNLDTHQVEIFKMSEMKDIITLKQKVLMRRGEPQYLSFEELVPKIKEYENLEKVEMYSEKEALQYLKARKAEIVTMEKSISSTNQSKLSYFKVTIGWFTVYGKSLLFIANAFEDLSHTPPARHEELHWWDSQNKYKY